LFCAQQSYGQQSKSISGFIRDSISGENIIGALVRNDTEKNRRLLINMDFLVYHFVERRPFWKFPQWDIEQRFYPFK